MRTSWIISFAAVCGVGAFVYVLAAKAPGRRRSSEPGASAGMPVSNTRALTPMPDSIDGLLEIIERNARSGRTPPSGRAHFALARAYTDADRDEDARKAWEDAARYRLEFVRGRGAQDPNAWFEAGWALWKLGKIDEARPALVEAEKLLSSLPHGERTDDVWHRLAWSRKLLGQELDAKIAWTRARDIAAQKPLWDADALYNLSCYLAQLGEKEGSLAALERAVAAGWNKAARALHDEDLETIRDEARFLELVQRMREAPGGVRFGPG